VFDRAYAVYPESIKGLFSILCSRYPALDYEYRYLRHAAMPQRRGASPRAWLPHGAVPLRALSATLAWTPSYANRGFDVLADAGDIGGRHESSFGVDDRATVARALGWIDSLPRGDRFFLAYLPIAGHHPTNRRSRVPSPPKTTSAATATRCITAMPRSAI
jgi:hypothetical protein